MTKWKERDRKKPKIIHSLDSAYVHDSKIYFVGLFFFRMSHLDNFLYGLQWINSVWLPAMFVEKPNILKMTLKKNLAEAS